MSKDETTQPAQRWKIGDVKANPPWTGVYFVCENCGGKFQLGAADECERVTDATPNQAALSRDAMRAEREARGSSVDLWLTPPCWTCEHRTVIKTPILDAGAIPGAS